MAESWQKRLQRECGEVHGALRAVLGRKLVGRELLSELEALATKRWFSQFAWLWGPYVWKQDRVLFRPFVLAHLPSFALTADGKDHRPWSGGEGVAELAWWMEDADRADDVEVFRSLYQWRLIELGSRGLGRRPDREKAWCQEIVKRAGGATDRTALHSQLARMDLRGLTLDEDSGIALYELDPVASTRFILHHLPQPWLFLENKSKLFWERLLDMAATRGDAELQFELYRRQVPEARWTSDVQKLMVAVKEPADLDRELERRHPARAMRNAAQVFYDLVQKRGRDAVPYVLRHARSVFPRWGWFGRTDAKGLPDLIDLVSERGWDDVWSTLLRTSASRETWNREMLRLVESKTSPEPSLRRKLLLLAGSGSELHIPGISFAQVHSLTDENATALFRRFPELLRGAFRMHVSSSGLEGYPKLTRAALDAGDDALIDFLASRAALLMHLRHRAGHAESVEALAACFEALPNETFAVRAGQALSMMPAFAVWNYDLLLKENRLARLLFERSTQLYATDKRTVRDLLESPQIYVQALAFRVLAQAPAALAVENADLLQATLLRPLHRRTRGLAFAALERAALHDETVARRLLTRMRDALALPDRRYPKDALVSLIGKVLHRWPGLRMRDEEPVIFRREARG